MIIYKDNMVIFISQFFQIATNLQKKVYQSMSLSDRTSLSQQQSTVSLQTAATTRKPTQKLSVYSSEKYQQKRVLETLREVNKADKQILIRLKNLADDFSRQTELMRQGYRITGIQIFPPGATFLPPHMRRQPNQ